MEEKRGLLSRLSGAVRWLLLLLLVSAAGAVIFRHVVTTQLDERIRQHLESQFAQHYVDLEVKIQSARRIVGKGIEIRHLSIASNTEGTEHRQLVSIDEIFATCDTDVAELILRKPCVRQLAIRRMRIHASRYPDGKWNVAKLLPPPQFGGRLPKVVIEDSSVELCDLSKSHGGSCAVRAIQLKAEPALAGEGQAVMRVAGTMHGDHFKQVALQGFFDPKSGNWSATGTMDGLEMSHRLLGSLPTDVAHYLSVLATLRARAHLGFQISHQRGAPEPFQFTLQGQLTEGRVDDARLPYPLTDLSAELHISNQRLIVKDVVGQMGPSSLKLSVTSGQFLQRPLAMVLRGKIERLPVDHRLHEVLPESLRNAWKKFEPAGVIDVTAELNIQNDQVQPVLTVDCHDVSFAYDKFPYRLNGGRGRIRLENDVLTMQDFTAFAEGQTVHLAAEFHHPGPQATGWLDVRSGGPLPLTDALIQALDERGQQITRSLHPTGMVTLTKGRFERLEAGQPGHKHLEIELHEMSVQYDKFPYPINRIGGTISVVDQQWTFANLQGFHGGSQIRAGGGWQPTTDEQLGGTLTLHFEGTDVPLDEELRSAVAALSEGGGRFWHNMRPRGAVDDLTVHVVFASRTEKTSVNIRAEKLPPAQRAESRSISIQPTWLAARLDDITGTVTFDNGQFALQNVRAMFGDSRIELVGSGSVDAQQRWQLHLTRAIADRFQAGQRVLDVLPSRMEAAVRQLNLRGPLSLNGSIWLRGGPSQALQAGWDLLLDIENVSTSSALGFEHIHGGIRLNGTMAANGFSSRGDIEIDSAVYRGVQITQVQGPFWIDSQQLILGSRAEAGRLDRAPRQVAARMLGGVLAFDAYVSLADQLPFVAEISFSDGDLAAIARTAHSAAGRLSGKVYAMLRVSGTSAGKDSLRGSGHVRLRNADVYQLPVMVELLSFLSLRQPDKTAFTSSDIEFRIQGDQLLYFDRIDFSGDAISLKGSGWMDLNRNVSLSFYALVGRYEFQLPIVRTLLAEASRNILAIQVVGTLDNPHVVSRPLPELEEALHRIFPEVYGRTAAPQPGTRISPGAQPSGRRPY